MLMSLLLALACAAGLRDLLLESDANRLWVPVDSNALEDDLKYQALLDSQPFQQVLVLPPCEYGVPLTAWLTSCTS